VASLSGTPGRLTLTGRPGGLDQPRPAFLGRRLCHLTSHVSTVVDASNGVGGLALRFDDRSHLTLEADGQDGRRTTITAVAALPGLRQRWSIEFPTGDIELSIGTVPATGAWPTRADAIRLCAGHGPNEVVLAELDGRYWSAETATYFTGRVVGLIATAGVVTFRQFRYRGSEAS
jgi:hypothetical protein